MFLHHFHNYFCTGTADEEAACLFPDDFLLCPDFFVNQLDRLELAGMINLN